VSEDAMRLDGQYNASDAARLIPEKPDTAPVCRVIPILRTHTAECAMFPIAKDTLTFREISDYWAREIQPPASQTELLAVLEKAWWLGGIRGVNTPPRHQLLRGMFQNLRNRSDPLIVFIQGEDESAPPELTQLEDGDVEVDLRVRVSVPAGDPNDWDEQTCQPAFQALAQTSSIKSYPELTPGFAGFELTHQEFFDWCELRQFPKPTFWRSPVSSLKRARRGRPNEYNWSGVRERLSIYASTNGPVQTKQELLHKCGDFAQELHPENERPDDSTISAAIKTHRLDTVAGMARGK
jgi:hypothetical protein